MKISIQVKTNSKKESVEKLSEGKFIVRVNVSPIEGKANERVRELLAKHLGLPKSRIAIIHGHRSKNKVFEIRY